MSLTRKELEQIATLARVELAPEKVDDVTRTIAGILDLFDELQAIETDGVEPMSHPLDMVQRLRADEVTEHDQRDALQAASSAVRDGLYLVPKVIEQD